MVESARTGELRAEPLRTGRLRLDPLDPTTDAADLHAAFADPGAMRFWDTPPTTGVEDTRQRLAAYREPRGAPQWTVREEPDGPAVGLVGLIGPADAPGLRWLVVPGRWGEGIGSEATTALVEYALGDGGVARVEAWIEVGNLASLGVARKAGLTYRGRLPQHYPHRPDPHASLVLGRAADPRADAVIGVVPELMVADPARTATLLAGVFGGCVQHVVGDPAELAVLGLDPWNGSARVHLVGAGGPLGRFRIRPTRLTVETATELEAVHRRACDAGLRVEQEPRDEPWHRREAVFRLPEGHWITVSGPL
jgi:RimJ/RimL family protein N-acetyltransferase/catechol 2,3-dioxygenase-like lactoylglutathione lyase family enzyme